MVAWILQHVAYEGPGAVPPAARAARFDVRLCRLDLGEPVPSPATGDAVVVLGGPMGVSDRDRLPHLDAELVMLRSCLAREVPVLGICLGAQLLAAAAGAAVTRGAVPEIGLGTVDLTAAGLDDPVLGAAGLPVLPVLHWHQDTFGIPPGATHLARSDAYPNQAFRLGRALALQFHVELDAGLAADVRSRLPEGVVLDPASVAAVQAAGRPVLDAFFRTAAAGFTGDAAAAEP